MRKLTLLKLDSKLLRICVAASRAFLSSEAKKVPLHDFHVSHGAKMVPFAGYSMPVQYSDQSLIQSHLHTRSAVSIFDVSHMLQTKIFGKHRIEFIESLIPSDIRALSNDHGALTVLTNDKGGIEDDLIVTKTSQDYLYVVTNAGCIDKDVAHFKRAVNTFRSMGFDVSVEHIDQSRQCLIAVQGPQTSKLFHASNCSIDFSKLYFMTSTICTVFGIEGCRLSRCGYTGEDGVEISIDSARAAELCEKLLSAKEAPVKLAGLGARDSLRLEAGLCLYGHDIDETTTPVEAGLSWVIGKRRRETADFPGAQIILSQVADKSLVKSKRIGFISDKGRPPRSGHRILDDHDREIGTITSGCPSPCLKKNISMGYCSTEFSGLGTALRIGVAGSSSPTAAVQVTKMPFVPTGYHSKSK